MEEQIIVPKSREEEFASHSFEWVKTDREGDICRFKEFVVENGIEYTCFMDNSRIKTELIGDIVFMHMYDNEILGKELLRFNQEANRSPVVEPEPVVEKIQFNPNVFVAPSSFEEPSIINHNVDPVISILEKTKKLTEKITLTLTVKIPSPELYTVIRDNFDNTDEILIDSIMIQLQENILRDALKKELQNIYFKKKKGVNGKLPA